jgi:hypothetical protein
VFNFVEVYFDLCNFLQGALNFSTKIILRSHLPNRPKKPPYLYLYFYLTFSLLPGGKKSFQVPVNVVIAFSYFVTRSVICYKRNMSEINVLKLKDYEKKKKKNFQGVRDPIPVTFESYRICS